MAASQSYSTQPVPFPVSFIIKLTRILIISPCGHNESGGEEIYRHSAEVLCFFCPTKYAKGLRSQFLFMEALLSREGAKSATSRQQHCYKKDDEKRGGMGRLPKQCAVKHDMLSEDLGLFLLCDIQHSILLSWVQL